MSFDPNTLLMLTAVIVATVGMLLLFAWAQNRSHRALLIWGVADLLFVAGYGLLLTRNAAPDAVSIGLAFATALIGYAVLWAGARVFNGRPVGLLPMAAGVAIWGAACAVPPFFRSPEWRAALISCIAAAYTLATSYELRSDRGEPLVSRYPLLGCLILHGILLLGRAGIFLLWALPQSPDMLKTPWVAAMGLEPLIVVIIVSFLLISMAKERSEFVQRRVASTDALTGVASRRAFLDEGARRLGAARKRGDEATLLLFDLDRFKQVNDCYGHHAGDHVLQLFAARIGETLRGGDLFGRIGGEEFAALLTGASVAQALEIAERCRATIAAFDFTLDGVPIRMAVSVGVSAARTRNCTIEELLGHADRALYLAKSAGRNRVHAYAPPPEPNWLAA